MHLGTVPGFIQSGIKVSDQLTCCGSNRFGLNAEVLKLALLPGFCQFSVIII